MTAGCLAHCSRAPFKKLTLSSQLSFSLFRSHLLHLSLTISIHLTFSLKSLSQSFHWQCFFLLQACLPRPFCLMISLSFALSQFLNISPFPSLPLTVSLSPSHCLPLSLSLSPALSLSLPLSLSHSLPLTVSSTLSLSLCLSLSDLYPL